MIGSQISLLDYEPEEIVLTPPIVFNPNIGDRVRVLRVTSPLPSYLVDKVGIVSELLCDIAVQVEIDDRTWGISTANLEPVKVSRPKFEIQIGDKVRTKNSEIWWMVSAQLDGGSWMVNHIIREPIPHTRTQEIISPADVIDHRTPPRSCSGSKQARDIEC